MGENVKTPKTPLEDLEGFKEWLSCFSKMTMLRLELHMSSKSTLTLSLVRIE